MTKKPMRKRFKNTLWADLPENEKERRLTILDEVAEHMARITAFTINDRVRCDLLQEEMPYAGQYILEKVIESLQSRV
jgi:hypothetical protein